MAILVTLGSEMECSFGASPSTLVCERTTSASEMPAATIMDFVPEENIPPFGMCSSLANPEVASATSAALGMLVFRCHCLTLRIKSPRVNSAGKGRVLRIDPDLRTPVRARRWTSKGAVSRTGRPRRGNATQRARRDRTFFFLLVEAARDVRLASTGVARRSSIVTRLSLRRGSAGTSTRRVVSS